MNVIKKGKTEEYVYDISLDGTVVNALGMNMLHNTDGFNFQLPDDSKYRYTKEHPYISTGMSRETEKDKEYTGFKADVAEFNDLYMRDFHYSPLGINKMGLGIDEVVSATINFARKNYADYFPDKPFPDDVKMIGNTIKSKKMPEYIAKFLAKGIRLLLQGKGKEFLDEYYLNVDKIYNLQIPLRDIASKGKIKRSIEEYKRDMKVITKAGRPKARQAWYELAIQNNISVANGDTIYYINTGKSKSHADAKKITHYYILDMFGEETEITKDAEKEFNKYKKELKKNEGTKKAQSREEFLAEHYPGYTTKEEIVLNCQLVPRDIIDKESDTFCSDVSDEMEYNVPKYIDQFNKRITPLLVGFDRSIRDKILVTNPKDRPYFIEEQCVLTSGQPNKPSDQDTYEQLMTMEDKEIRFWLNNDLIPPFIEECGMGSWEDIKNDYLERMSKEKELGIDKDKEVYIKAINNLSRDEIIEFCEDGEMPPSIANIIDVDPVSGNFVSKKYPDVKIGSIDDILDRYEYVNMMDDVEDSE